MLGVIVTSSEVVLAARTSEESGGGKQTAHVQSGPTGGQFTSSPGAKSTPTKPTVKRPVPKRSLPSKSQVTPIKKKRRSLSRKGPNDPAEVKQLQALLKELKISGLSVDGNYGSDTEAAVKAVQEKLGLPVTGRCSASLLGTLEKVHALSPCVVRAASQIMAAAGPVGYDDDDEVLDKVEIAPGTWVCAHADGTVSMRMPSDAMTTWAEAVLDMAEVSDEEPDDEDSGEYVEAAAGHDTSAGHDELHHYWTRGPGLARWAESPTPWTSLLAALVEAVEGKPLETLKKWASAWFIEVKGYAAGSDKNRVAHGKPPRGEKVGPG